MKHHVVYFLFFTLILVGLGFMGHVDAADKNATDRQVQSADVQRDRQAILAMAGCYEVTFDFHETVALAEGYEFAKPKLAKALEWVEVVENSPTRIVLQHLLIANDNVIKHWRQDWTYEDQTIQVYTQPGVWEIQTFSREEIKGTWAQHVYQTDDSPRYGSYGKWVHEANLSYWESQWSNRPLPRREYTTREDYQILKARNRHTITPDGWVHEQDNYKVVVDENGQTQKVLVREIGLNTYKKVEKQQGEVAQQWWEEHQHFWADVRTVWEEVYDARPTLVLKVDNRGLTLRREINRLEHEFINKTDPQAYDAKEVRTRIRQVVESYREDTKTTMR